MKQVGFLGIDNYGTCYHMQKHPRKELLEQIGATKAHKMYIDTEGGKSRHVGYVINGLWINIYQVYQWKE